MIRVRLRRYAMVKDGVVINIITATGTHFTSDPLYEAQACDEYVEVFVDPDAPALSPGIGWVRNLLGGFDPPQEPE